MGCAASSTADVDRANGQELAADRNKSRIAATIDGPAAASEGGLRQAASEPTSRRASHCAVPDLLQVGGAGSLPVLDYAALSNALSNLKEPVAVLCVLRVDQRAAEPADGLLNTLNTHSTGFPSSRPSPDARPVSQVTLERPDANCLQLVFNAEDGAIVVGCVMTNAAAAKMLSLAGEQDILRFLATALDRDPALRTLFHDLILRLLCGVMSSVSHFVPGDFGRERYFLSMRVSPFAYRCASMFGTSDVLRGDASAVRAGGVLPALVLELDMPYEGKELAARLQRDYLCLSSIPSAVTIFDTAGRVLHQNRASIAFMGYLVGLATPATTPTHTPERVTATDTGRDTSNTVPGGSRPEPSVDTTGAHTPGAASTRTTVVGFVGNSSSRADRMLAFVESRASGLPSTGMPGGMGAARPRLDVGRATPAGTPRFNVRRSGNFAIMASTEFWPDLHSSVDVATSSAQVQPASTPVPGVGAAGVGSAPSEDVASRAPRGSNTTDILNVGPGSTGRTSPPGSQTVPHTATPLQSLFACDPARLAEAMETVRQGREWTGMVRMPQRLGVSLDTPLHTTAGNAADPAGLRPGSSAALDLNSGPHHSVSEAAAGTSVGLDWNTLRVASGSSPAAFQGATSTAAASWMAAGTAQGAAATSRDCARSAAAVTPRLGSSGSMTRPIRQRSRLGFPSAHSTHDSETGTRAEHDLGHSRSATTSSPRYTPELSVGRGLSPPPMPTAGASGSRNRRTSLRMLRGPALPTLPSEGEVNIAAPVDTHGSCDEGGFGSNLLPPREAIDRGAGPHIVPYTGWHTPPEGLGPGVGMVGLHGETIESTGENSGVVGHFGGLLGTSNNNSLDHPSAGHTNNAFSLELLALPQASTLSPRASTHTRASPVRSLGLQSPTTALDATSSEEPVTQPKGSESIVRVAAQGAAGSSKGSSSGGAMGRIGSPAGSTARRRQTSVDMLWTAPSSTTPTSSIIDGGTGGVAGDTGVGENVEGVRAMSQRIRAISTDGSVYSAGTGAAGSLPLPRLSGAGTAMVGTRDSSLFGTAPDAGPTSQDAPSQLPPSLQAMAALAVLSPADTGSGMSGGGALGQGLDRAMQIASSVPPPPATAAIAPAGTSPVQGLTGVPGPTPAAHLLAGRVSAEQSSSILMSSSQSQHRSSSRGGHSSSATAAASSTGVAGAVTSTDGGGELSFGLAKLANPISGGSGHSSLVRASTFGALISQIRRRAGGSTGEGPTPAATSNASARRVTSTESGETSWALPAPATGSRAQSSGPRLILASAMPPPQPLNPTLSDPPPSSPFARFSQPVQPTSVAPSPRRSPRQRSNASPFSRRSQPTQPLLPEDDASSHRQRLKALLRMLATSGEQRDSVAGRGRGASRAAAPPVVGRSATGPQIEWAEPTSPLSPGDATTQGRSGTITERTSSKVSWNPFSRGVSVPAETALTTMATTLQPAPSTTDRSSLLGTGPSPAWLGQTGPAPLWPVSPVHRADTLGEPDAWSAPTRLSPSLPIGLEAAQGPESAQVQAQIQAPGLSQGLMKQDLSAGPWPSLGGKEQGEVVVGPAPGGTRWHEVSVRPCADPLSSEPLILVVQTDVTSKVRAEAALVEALEAEHRLLSDIFPSHVLRHMTAARRAKAAEERQNALEGGLGLLRHIADPAVLATHHNSVSVLFADIKGFTQMSKEVPAAVVMTFLNSLYTRFDGLTDIYGVYKVETIGDCYMVAGGLMASDRTGGPLGYGRSVRGEGDTDPLHALRVVAFARAMLAEAAKVPLPNTGEPTQVRVGIHSGSATSGVVGLKMPRFCLFGDTINTASRMESTGFPGSIHISAATRGLLPPEEDDEGWQPTGGIEVKGKGVMETFRWEPRPSDDGRRHRSRQQRAAMLLGTLQGRGPGSGRLAAALAAANASTPGNVVV
ncbi:hypothetical protein HYH03_008923 [Edaphochlamys debaryana]|uniref:Guanylate cyclase domain-containing protein n=1 Tax=Edaphochlamys debaryana TaxID=47281 RepID=A0A835Y155_9CHLO|nr:hypothetical protein HYH03_008923 [Edaphochlamys debaryana]|eukprot:KAG2492758.1 hypothetical protein HYH03_008923 [Edaphochlamys debaryana]